MMSRFLELCVSQHTFPGKWNKLKSKRWIFLVSGEFIGRLETFIIVRKPWEREFCIIWALKIFAVKVRAKCQTLFSWSQTERKRLFILTQSKNYSPMITNINI